MKIPLHTETDVLVIGAGIAGCIAAISLSDRYRITLIDKLAGPVDRIGESLVPAARRILKKLNLLTDVQDTNADLWIESPGMQSHWGTDRMHLVDHLFNPDGSVLLLDRKGFEIFLREKAVERGVRGFWPVTYYSSLYDYDGWEVIVRSDENRPRGGRTHCIKTRYVIDASGRQARFARSQKIPREHFDNLVTYWASMPDETKNRMSTISSEEKGWWYSAPVPHSNRVMAFQTDPDLIDRRAYSDESYFLSIAKENKEMNKLLEHSSGPVTFHGSVSSNSSRLSQMAGNQWVALGDAAMSFDPLSSQGMFHAMASAMQFCDLIRQSDCISHPDAQNMEQIKEEYTEQMDQIWQQYRLHHRMYYLSEQRWKDNPFWSRRHGDPKS